MLCFPKQIQTATFLFDHCTDVLTRGLDITKVPGDDADL